MPFKKGEKVILVQPFGELEVEVVDDERDGKVRVTIGDRKHSFPVDRVRRYGTTNTRVVTFVKRDQYFQHVVGGGVVGNAEDGIYLTVTGTAVFRGQLKDQMTEAEMSEWIRSLREAGFTLSAADGKGHPLTIS
jgi:hypothetical protein